MLPRGIVLVCGDARDRVSGIGHLLPPCRVRCHHRYSTRRFADRFHRRRISFGALPSIEPAFAEYPARIRGIWRNGLVASGRRSVESVRGDKRGWARCRRRDEVGSGSPVGDEQMCGAEGTSLSRTWPSQGRFGLSLSSEGFLPSGGRARPERYPRYRKPLRGAGASGPTRRRRVCRPHPKSRGCRSTSKSAMA